MSDYTEDQYTSAQEQESSYPYRSGESEPYSRVYTQPAQPPKKKPRYAGIIALALCCSLLGSILGAGGVLLVQNLTGKEESSAQSSNVANVLLGQRESSVIETVSVQTGQLMTAAEVYAANVNSTVGITTSITTNYWGYTSTSAASGSGFIISDDGYILTNFHVIEDSDSITVSLYNGESYEATLIGYDESNDIAVLKIEAENLVPVILGDSDNLNVGDSVVAIGNPLGELTFSLTAGTVSAKDREVTLSSSVTMNLLQTDCAINSGNSGGALFNMYGEVIGITNAKYSSSSSSEASIDNIGFAIPINSVWSIVESIIEKGYISKPYIGVTMVDVSSAYQIYGLPQGAAIQSVTEGAPAEAAGLQVGDIVTMAGETEITCSSDLKAVVSATQPGDVLTLTVYRQGTYVTVSVTVGEQQQSALGESSSQQTQQSTHGNFPWGSR